MKIAVSTDNGNVSAHFGRCASYTIYDIDESNILAKEEIPNPGHEPGFLPQFLSEKEFHSRANACPQQKPHHAWPESP